MARGYLVEGWMAAQLALLVLLIFVQPEADYADLVPAPDSIIWEEGQESTVLVSTNLDDVEMRIYSVAMGIESVQGIAPYSGELMVLGASVGCQDWAVSRLTAVVNSPTSITLQGNIDRGNFTSTAQVDIRSRAAGDAVWTTLSPVDVTYDPDDLDASNGFSQALTVSEGELEFEASSDGDFPIALTRFISVDTAEGTATTDEEVESIVLLEDTGVALKACSEQGDVLLTLQGLDAEELNRYVVDIGPEPTATPSPYAGSMTRRVCVDDTANRSGYLTGGENVGSTFNNTDFGLANDIEELTIGGVEDGPVSRYFFDYTLTDGEVQILVSDAGAADTQGLTNDQVYLVRLTASDSTGQENFLDLAVWLDTSTLSPNDDGLCT